MASTLPNPVLLEAAIRARLIASMAHADIGVTPQSVSAHMAGSVARAEYGAHPYIVFDLVRGTFIGTFGADGIDAIYRVTIYDHPENAENGAAAMAFEGISGNWHPVDNLTPDYGLHMWMPSVSGMNPCTLIARDFSTPHTPNLLEYQIMFEAKMYNEE